MPTSSPSAAGAAERVRPARRPAGDAIAGHLRTVGGLVRRTLWPPSAPPSQDFRATVDDPVTGPQPVVGRLSRPPGARRLAVFLHGLGGSSGSPYLAALAGAAVRRGLASLRLGLRGADGVGCDIYHAGLTRDVHAALAAPALAGFDEVVLAGMSLGGHVALRYATESGDPRLRAVAAVSAPLDLAAGAAAIDRPLMAPYRAYLLGGLRVHGRRACRAGILAATPRALDAVRRLRDWDSLTVAPRFGFADAADYYARASVGPRIGELRCPALLLAATADPLVPPAAIRPALAAAGRPAALTLDWQRRAGHLAFGRALDLGAGAARGFGPEARLGEQILSWLCRHSREAAA